MPDGLAPLIDDGIIQRVLRPLMSGKEAQVYLVEARGEVCVAKVYKEAHNRSFKHRAEYTEGRRTRNSRDQRAMHKRSKHGRAQDEAAWRSTEVDMIHRLHAGGVRVPVPYIFIDGVLVMECIGDHEGNPAPRLSDLSLDPDTAHEVYHRVIQEVVRMLAVGVVHGDLSEFNVLIGSDGPVIIDFPQSVDTASNTNARRLLLRDVENFHRFLARSVPNARRLPYAEEMWDLFELNALTAETRLTGRYRAPQRRMSTESVRDLIHDADRDERKRRDALGLRGGPRQPSPPQQRSQAPQQHAQRGSRPEQQQHSQRGPRPEQQQHAQRGPRPEQPQRTRERPQGGEPQAHTRTPARNRPGPAPEVIIVRRPPR